VALLALAAAPAPARADTIQVSNVRARQLADGTVEVLYDLNNVSASGAVVVVFFSTGGGPYNIRPSDSALSGDVGPRIKNGANHRIVWNALATLPQEFSSTTMRAAVDALDPTGGAAESGGSPPASPSRWFASRPGPSPWGRRPTSGIEAATRISTR